MNASLQELNECISDAIADRDTLRNNHNSNGNDIRNLHNGDYHHYQSDLPGIF